MLALAPSFRRTKPLPHGDRAARGKLAPRFFGYEQAQDSAHKTGIVGNYLEHTVSKLIITIMLKVLVGIKPTHLVLLPSSNFYYDQVARLAAIPELNPPSGLIFITNMIINLVLIIMLIEQRPKAAPGPSSPP